jgi:predicted ferric reductase
MVVLIALVARIPPLERGIGADRLARWHAKGGRYAVSLVVAHGLLITWGYAVSAHTDVVTEGSRLLRSYPDVLMATVAGLLLVGVGVTSARAARKRLRYETWYFLHFSTYLAVALAFSHQFATGADFMTSLRARLVWGGMYAAVAAAILWYRFLVPVRQALRHQLRVESVQPEADGVVSIVVSGRHLEELQAESGQFFRWRFLTRDLWWVSSPYSLSAPIRPDRMRFTVKALGEHSAALPELVPGTRVLTEGPYGALTPAGAVPDDPFSTRRSHPGVPGQHRGRRGLPGRARSHRRRPQRAAARPHRPACGARQRPSQRRCPAGPRP